MHGGSIATTQEWNVSKHVFRSSPASPAAVDRHCFNAAAQGGRGGGGGSAISMQERSCWPHALRASAPPSSAFSKQVRAVVAHARIAVWIS
jgi:hypothetical protein